MGSNAHSGRRMRVGHRPGDGASVDDVTEDIRWKSRPVTDPLSAGRTSGHLPSRTCSFRPRINCSQHTHHIRLLFNGLPPVANLPTLPSTCRGPENVRDLVDGGYKWKPVLAALARKSRRLQRVVSNPKVRIRGAGLAGGRPVRN
jgi:hypothetical protein